MPQDNSIPLQGFQGPSPVDNFLSAYSASQQQKQGNELHAGRMKAMAQAEEDRKRQMVADALVMVQDGDQAGFENVKRQLISQGAIDPATASQYDITRLPQLKMMSEKWREMKKFEMEQQAAGQRGRLTEAQIAAANRSNQGGGGSGVLNNAMQRAQLAQAFGIDPASPAGQKFALTGQLPAPLSATDKKAVLEADQMARATKEGLGALRQARVLSGKASQGWGANTISQGLSLLGDETAVNTLDFDNIIKSNVLPQLKVIFGGAPTEGERAVLLELQGSSSLSRENRQRILDRAIKAAEDRLQFYNSQAQDLRGGTYYSPTRGQQSAPAAAPTQSAPQAAKKKWTTPEGFTIEEVD